ncbi:polysaccharide pyruvyl transferase family protein [Agrococcus sp. KRD186]|uniref:polysaccharide pyruvyl transferase family protein n=1 Tax=Agrococcus sp. KRD186 TaxID=2729730 RepID=UPI0019D07160
MSAPSPDDRLPSQPKWVRLGEVEVFRWLPMRRAVIPEHQPVNFGDELAIEVVRAMAVSHGLDTAPPPTLSEPEEPLSSDEGAPVPVPKALARLLSVGSVLHFAADGDVVWGAGINGKIANAISSTSLDIRSVRGPLTRAVLAEAGIDCPAVFGDPALLLPRLMPELTRRRPTTRPLSVIPNLNDLPSMLGEPWLVQPTEPFAHVIHAIAESEVVVSSSLHGIVLAEAMGVPVRPMRSGAEHRFKYDDYAEGTGRRPFELAATVAAALAMGPLPPLEWDPAPLEAAFPADLWAPRPLSAAAVAPERDAAP